MSVPHRCSFYPQEAGKLEELQFEDFIIEGYNPYPTIKMEMAV